MGLLSSQQQPHHTLKTYRQVCNCFLCTSQTTTDSSIELSPEESQLVHSIYMDQPQHPVVADDALVAPTAMSQTQPEQSFNLGIQYPNIFDTDNNIPKVDFEAAMTERLFSNKKNTTACTFVDWVEYMRIKNERMRIKNEQTGCPQPNNQPMVDSTATWRFDVKHNFTDTFGPNDPSIFQFDHEGIPFCRIYRPNLLYRKLTTRDISALHTKASKEGYPKASGDSYMFEKGPVTFLEDSYWDFFQAHTSTNEDGTIGRHYGRVITYGNLDNGISNQFTTDLVSTLISKCPKCGPGHNKQSKAFKKPELVERKTATQKATNASRKAENMAKKKRRAEELEACGILPEPLVKKVTRKNNKKNAKPPAVDAQAYGNNMTEDDYQQISEQATQAAQQTKPLAASSASNASLDYSPTMEEQYSRQMQNVEIQHMPKQARQDAQQAMPLANPVAFNASMEETQHNHPAMEDDLQFDLDYMSASQPPSGQQANSFAPRGLQSMHHGFIELIPSEWRGLQHEQQTNSSTVTQAFDQMDMGMNYPTSSSNERHALSPNAVRILDSTAPQVFDSNSQFGQQVNAFIDSQMDVVSGMDTNILFDYQQPYESELAGSLSGL